jgi:chromosome segregation ATPase
MTDLAEDFMAPIHAREQKLAELDAQIANKQRELATLEGECAVARQAMNDLAGQRNELQAAVNTHRALLAQSQSDLSKAQGMFEALRKKVASLPTRLAS